MAGALGFSVEDCATAIGLMANSGIKASQAGTSLRSIFSRMAKPTDEVKAAMDQLGVSLTNSDGSMKSLKEVMKDLRSGFAGLTEAQKAQMASALGHIMDRLQPSGSVVTSIAERLAQMQKSGKHCS